MVKFTAFDQSRRVFNSTRLTTLPHLQQRSRHHPCRFGTQSGVAKGYRFIAIIQSQLYFCCGKIAFGANENELIG
jgi:hypothetical protein